MTALFVVYNGVRNRNSIICRKVSVHIPRHKRRGFTFHVRVFRWTFTFFFFFFFGEVDPNWNPRTQALWSIALYLSFKFIKGYFGGPAPVPRPRSHSDSPLLFVLDPSWQNRPRSAPSPFATSGIRTKCVPTFRFLHRISCMRESFLSSSCAACTADWYARLGALPHSAMFPVQFTYELNIPISWSLQTQLAGPILCTDFPFCLFSFFNPTPYFGLKPA